MATEHLYIHTPRNLRPNELTFIPRFQAYINHCTMAPTQRPETLLSRREVEGLIAEGRSIIIVDQKVLKVDPWLKYHPGGDKAIRHMVGKDATDEVNAFVLPSFRNL